jgi:dynein heavy chain
MQDKHRKTLADNLTKIEKDISILLTDSCNASMRTFKEENRIALSDEFFGDDSSSVRENNEDEKAGFLVGDETHKQMPYTQEATLRTHYNFLSKFIRLTDFLIVDARLKLI